MKKRLFISYTSKDPAISEERLRIVETKLKPFASVFIDKLHNKNGGQCRVNLELWRCDALIQLVSADYQSEWAKKELMTARKRRRPVVKITIDDLLKKDEEELFLILDEIEMKRWSVWCILTLSVLVCLGISFLGIWLSYLYVSKQPGVSDVMSSRGLFGDSWGGVNAIISAFAFAGVIVTLFLQNRDLNLQRKEMARQREEFEKENETLKYQRFENLFYNMLNLQQEIVAGLKFEYMEDETVLVPSGTDNMPIQEKRKVLRSVNGREVFRFTFEEAEIGISEKDQFGQERFVRGYRNFLKRKGIIAYDTTWIPTYYDHYFRHLYKIIQFVDNQRFKYEEAYMYISLLRGTLSRYELVWIYYNALNPSFKKFKKLIEKYCLLNNIREDLLTRCLETDKYFKGLGMTVQMVRDKGFSGLDFEFFLTDSLDSASKYNLFAFWKREEIEEGSDYLLRWNNFINDAARRVVK